MSWNNLITTFLCVLATQAMHMVEIDIFYVLRLVPESHHQVHSSA
jgi:hypothetical protein